MATLDFLILGPFQVVDHQPLALGGPRQRAVLALLLLNRREVVTTDRMIDELWGEHAPPTVGKAIHVYISNLRKVVGDGLLLTSDGGYKLDVEPSQVDADRFDALVSRGRTALERGYPVMARQRLREALGLWRGRPLADFSYHQFAQAEIARLEEARMAALEDRIEAELALGAHSTLVPELETHVRAHPARERLWGQLMVALYRSGRQADALERYRRARRVLIDEFAIEPGRDLKEIEHAILTQDPALDAPAMDPAMSEQRPGSVPDPDAAIAPSPPSDGDAAGTAATGADSAPPLSGQPPSETPESALQSSRVADVLPGSAAVISRVRALRRMIDAHWREQRVAIAAGSALLLVGVILVALLTGGGGSKARSAAHAQPSGCSRCVASISSPRNGGIYSVGQSVPTKFSCADASRGQALASCDDSTGTHTKAGGHGRLDTSTPGVHTYTVTVALRSGATKAAARVSYRVVGPLVTSIGTASATVSNRHTRITLSCAGGPPGAACRGTLVLKMRQLIGGRVRLVGIGRASYALSTGSSRPVVLRLTHLGMKALRRAAGHHRRVKAIATRSGRHPAVRAIRLQLS
jgi:DNA-binding SARP family transcriptional activator